MNSDFDDNRLETAKRMMRTARLARECVQILYDGATEIRGDQSIDIVRDLVRERQDLDRRIRGTAEDIQERFPEHLDSLNRLLYSEKESGEQREKTDDAS